MTREYPPFRLDLGGDDPGGGTLAFGTPAAPAGGEAAPGSTVAEARAAAAPARPAGTTAGKVVALLFGSLGILVSLALLAAGGVTVWAYQTQRDSAGFLMSPTDRFTTDTFAVTTDFRKTSNALASDVLDTTIEGPSWLFTSSRFGSVRIHGTSLSSKALFIGVGPTASVERYLASVGHEEVTGYANGSPRYRLVAGTRAAEPPATQAFWVASTSGRGEQAVTWRVAEGNWTVVAMNADGSPGLDAELSLGARLSFLLWVGIVLLAVAAVVLAGAIGLVAVGARSPRPPV